MSKRALLSPFVLLAATALTSVGTLASSGKGRTATADGRTGSFTYSVAKKTAGSAVVLSGRLRCEQQPTASGPYALIEMGVPSVLTVASNGKVAEFSGRGTITVLVNGVRKTYNGTVSVRAADKHLPGGTDHDVDAFRIRFVGDLQFESDGALTDGDLVVTSS